MLFKSLFATAVYASAALAQAIAFTSFPPSSIQVGSTVTVTYSGGTSAPATITLRKGTQTDLKDVKVLGTATGGSFSFTLTSDLVDGSDYALQITQGSDINYTGQFAVAGGSSSSSSASVSASVSSLTASASSALSSASSAISSISSAASANSSSISAAASSSANSTVTRASATSTSLSTSTRTSTSSSASSSASSTGGATGGSSSSATGLGSPIALVLCVAAGLLYLN